MECFYFHWCYFYSRFTQSHLLLTMESLNHPSLVDPVLDNVLKMKGHNLGPASKDNTLSRCASMPETNADKTPITSATSNGTG